jgi:hypothetical protein
MTAGDHRDLQAAGAGLAGDFRSWLRPVTIVIWSSKTQTSFFWGFAPAAHRKGN